MILVVKQNQSTVIYYKHLMLVTITFIVLWIDNFCKFEYVTKLRVCIQGG